MTQRVLITAGASGIGWAIAQAFLAQGSQVHVFDVDQGAVDNVLGGRENLSGSVGDVTSEEDVVRLVRALREKWGGLDVLVSNAGIAGPTAPVEDYEPAAWRSVVDVNLNGSFNVVHQIVPLLKDSGGGSILVMSSLAGRFGYPNRIAYSTTKWGLIGFTKTLSLELGPHGITVNSIHPGAVQGERLDRVFEGRAELSGRSIEEEKAAGMENQAIKSFTDPADIGALAVFLSGPHARTISGQQFPIDGDSKAAQ
ncbi:SDR family oxidoreductase [Corynebacterium halotolerans]|uniref:3-oxoacyl-[acyl-carrier-protein] reductase MabA n=1 Tax=Corynebacterium halotolerans YIM 70093 = DSM 44683 TaxID=1121362 RepID=M1NIB7_9CORY|nr:SDR family oxidoreductase [Corynebacterium halotolerans]AGF71153.1 3-ketoacyl-(acyl-carrier-protein) reductase [Corynebacterium halotolerans YIM 70093 = DSM 44683]